MRDSFLPFTRPSITEAEILEVSEALRSGGITSGPRVAAFEKEFSAYVSAPFGIAVTSATARFHILLHALGIGRIVSMPLFPDMQEEDVVKVVDEIRDALSIRMR